MADASAAAAEAKPAVFVPPPKIEELFAQASGQMATVNRPVAGAKREEELPEGSAPIQLYSAGTPNGAKVSDGQGRGQGQKREQGACTCNRVILRGHMSFHEN